MCVSIPASYTNLYTYIHVCVCVYVYFYMYIFNIHKIEPIFNVLKSVPFKKSISDFA